MGLALSVGLLSDLKQNDPEGAEEVEDTFRALNTLLDHHGLPRHVEPTEIEPWGADLFGYSGLHYLRRLAAHVDSGVELPTPGDQNSSSDATLKAYFDHVTGNSGGIFKSLFRKPKTFRRGFDHLIVHSDAEGFYLPQQFPDVLFAADDLPVPGGMVGSIPKLKNECERLARILEIPSTLTKDADELWEAADSQGEGDELWQRYGVEAFTCVALKEACIQSLQSGAALVFA